MSGTVSCSIDLDSPGKDAGYLLIGNSTNNSGWATYQVPIIKVAHGDGPTMLVLGGNHGDEYEGQIAASALSRELEVKDVRGRIIIIPCLSQDASRAGNRLWPNGANFNRSFPGKENGTLNEKLAHYISTELFPICDGVLDMHSGGRSMYFIPSSNMVWVSDLKLRKEMIKNMIAWNTDAHMIGAEQPGTNPYSLLPGEAVRQGISVSTGEFGGSGYTTPATVRNIKAGLKNFLRTFGVLEGKPVTREGQGLEPALILDGRNPKGFVLASRAGIYENCVPLGSDVQAGALVGKIHDFDHPDVNPSEVYAHISGVINLIRGFPPVTTGDVVCVVTPQYASIEEFERAAG